MRRHRRLMNQLSSLHKQCMCCSGTYLDIFYEVRSVPVNSNLLLNTLSEALCCDTRDIKLGICRDCGFISNVAYDPTILVQSNRYESTQSHSATNNTFLWNTAEDSVERFGFHEFLTTLSELGDNIGLDFDPTYIADPSPEARQPREIRFISDYYTEHYAHYNSDTVCCKMKLEHVHDVARSAQMVRKTIGSKLHTVVFCQVHNMLRILEKGAVWDISYEHCSYFSPAVLAHLFVRYSFEVLNVCTAHNDQYVLLEARANQSGRIDDANLRLTQKWELNTLVNAAMEFADLAEAEVSEWNRRLDSWQQAGLRGVAWGGGSRAVAFLSALGRSLPIGAAVDINPKKHGTYLPVSGLQVVAPEFLIDYKPDFIIVMNPVYLEEIRQCTNALDVKVHLVPLE